MNHVNSNSETFVDSTIEKVESWLDEHPQFVHDYFVRKVTRQMVDSWLHFHYIQNIVQPSSRLINTNPALQNICPGSATSTRKISGQELERGTNLSSCLISQLFEVSRSSTVKYRQRKEEICIPWGKSFVGHLAEYGKSLNIPDCYKNNRSSRIIDCRTQYRIPNILCMPILDEEDDVKGLPQVIKKCRGEELFKNTDKKVFAILCGLGIQYTQLYKRTTKVFDETKATLQVLSYHATVRFDKVQKLLRESHIPSTEMCRLYDLNFDYFSLNDRGMLKACFRMFMDFGFIQRFGMKYDGNQILSHLSSEEYMYAVHILEDAILATDFPAYSKSHFSFMQIARNGNYNWKNEDNRKLLRRMHMTACDIAAVTKPWKTHKKVNPF
ncbi:phosphodiesterase [Caerostris darwini]|uniref:Phosphodiesterase n=1 Tax=Caerostris darwini TaxID=1538125 RepID=A0AAV4RWK4_9ARAC|nr:phosphodiesterase [Caerostris darwini]